uniref:Uncharacterized protein n=1 Tax=Zea mays TaxID=4577 RepID=C0PIF5_MAIZE|nr:unknown [Zea mays]
MPITASTLREDWKSSQGEGTQPPSTNLRRRHPVSQGWCWNALLVLRVVGADRGEVDARVARHQRRVFAQARRRDRAAHGDHRDADGGTGLDSQPGLHGRWRVPPPRLTSFAPGQERQI